jgi:hypothetical protein
MAMMLKEAFKFSSLVCGNNAAKQKTIHSSPAYYVHALLYNIARQAVYVLTLCSFDNHKYK